MIYTLIEALDIESNVNLYLALALIHMLEIEMKLNIKGHIKNIACLLDSISKIDIVIYITPMVMQHACYCLWSILSNLYLVLLVVVALK